jgi:hypothetical protein
LVTVTFVEHEGKTKVKGGIICAIKTNEGFAFLET